MLDHPENRFADPPGEAVPELAADPEVSGAPRTIVKRHSWIAVLLSLVWPGLGHLYNGEVVSALAALLATAAVALSALYVGLAAFWGLVLCVAVGFIVVLAVASHAGLRAYSLGQIESRWYTRWYTLAAIVGLVALVYPSVWTAAVLPQLRYRAFRVRTSSMEPTIRMGDRFVVDTWRYHETPPQRGDLVVFTYPPSPDRDMVKRCVAVPGDTVQIAGKELLVNGEKIREDYAKRADPMTFPPDTPSPVLRSRDHFGPLKLPEGSYFVLGDNRDNSFDSRFWGPVRADQIKGRALYIYWSAYRSHIGKRLE